MANFFVKPGDSFNITLPFDVSGPEAQVIFVESLSDYPKQLQQIPEDKIEYHWMKFRKPDWGLDCYLRELAHDGSGTRDRTFSPEKFDEARLRFLLLDSSFFPETDRVNFSRSGNYDILSSTSENFIKQLSPFILRLFLVIASRIWDLGYQTSGLLAPEDYRMLRNDKEGLRKVSEAKGLINRTALANPDDPEDKKK